MVTSEASLCWWKHTDARLRLHFRGFLVSDPPVFLGGEFSFLQRSAFQTRNKNKATRARGLEAGGQRFSLGRFRGRVR